MLFGKKILSQIYMNEYYLTSNNFHHKKLKTLETKYNKILDGFFCDIKLRQKRC